MTVFNVFDRFLSPSSSYTHVKFITRVELKIVENFLLNLTLLDMPNVAIALKDILLHFIVFEQCFDYSPHLFAIAILFNRLCCNRTYLPVYYI